ncbi:MAG TPA: hypothetical protein ENN91_06270 [Firmicutes bacterium]|nr:hypothetical protein [Bacillota bacterium]
MSGRGRLFSAWIRVMVVLTVILLSVFCFAGSCLAENGAEFEPADDPFMEFVRARSTNQPIVVEFYARW